MCGRFVSVSPPDELAKYFAAQQVGEASLEPSYNVAPTSDIYAVMESGGVRRLETFHWGLVPFWAKDPSAGNKMINARAESLATKSAYRRAFTKRRCIIPADGFYEWQKVPGQKTKQPHFIHRIDGEPLGFAGLWELWRPKDAPEGDDSQLLRSCTIITGQPNKKMAAIHDRMPVILPPNVWDEWLDPANGDLDSLNKLLVPAPSEIIELYPVSTAVNNVKQKGPELIAPASQ
jgi:putative SOS response-associated peptidase YedK